VRALQKLKWLCVVGGLVFGTVAVNAWSADAEKRAVSAATQAMLQRLTAGHQSVFHLETMALVNGRDQFEVSVADGKVVLKGSSPVAIASALNQFLRDSGQGHLSWGGDRLALTTLQAKTLPVTRRVSPVELAYQFNFTAHGYTTPYWSWQEWQREIDLMAFNGITHALTIAGIEEVYIRTFAAFGYSRKEIRDWLVLPAHLPWQLMGNMHSDSPVLSEALVAKRVTLGRRIVDEMKALEMVPVIPGYYGLVPDDFSRRQMDIISLKKIGRAA